MGLSSLWPLSSIEMYFSLVLLHQPRPSHAAEPRPEPLRRGGEQRPRGVDRRGPRLHRPGARREHAAHPVDPPVLALGGPELRAGHRRAGGPLRVRLVALPLPRAPPLRPRRGERLAHGHPQRREVPGEARPVGRRPLHRDAGRLPGRRDRPGERLVSRRVGGELAGQDLAAPPVQDAQPVRVGVGVDPAEDRPAGAGCRFGSHVSLRSFRARLDRADGTLTGRDRMRLFGSAVSLHAPIRSCGGLGSPRPARDMSGNEGSPMGASGMWGHRAVRI